MKYFRLILVGCLVGFGGSALMKVSSADSPYCTADYRKDTVVKTRKVQVEAEVAKTPQQQEKGLSGRSCIGYDQGMLFVFDEPGKYDFWMKDMKFPIDIIWIAAGHKVVTVEKNVSPDTYPKTYINDEPAQFVLELMAGQAAKLGIHEGSSLDF